MEAFSPEEIEIIKSLVEDWGFEYGLKAKRPAVLALAQKLQMDDYVKRNKDTD